MSKVKDLIESIINDFQMGASIRELVIMYGLPHTNIIQILADYNIKETL